MKKIILFIVSLLLIGCQSMRVVSLKNYQFASIISNEPHVYEPSQHESDARVSASTHFITLILDPQGRIYDLDIDAMRSDIVVLRNGTIQFPLEAASNKTKKDAYNMRQYSVIDKEWYQQIEAIEAFLLHKNKEEISSLLFQNGVLQEEDLMSGATIKSEPIIKSVLKAFDHVEKIPQAISRFGVSSKTAYHLEKDVTNEHPGEIHITTSYASVLLDDDNKVVRVQTDELVDKILFYHDGTFEESGPYKSKKSLKDAYQMKSVSTIKKEWYEQNEVFESLFIGKNLVDIQKILVNDYGKLAHSDLSSSVTIRIKPLKEVVIEAINQARILVR